ncbi:lipocalin family protein [Vibrio sp. CAU 1672]|uniref:lipocalin family protein n=1 Tax=Vibrio sp. CAU 1672 TaxID=3032594 RepID=UPI0023DA5879|nr:lipocalin family protein [Vibrio sp. CAU 1672]MDF2153461.1 lipocalin family protein [Vibrio sp. CAU 1672]
MKTFNLFLALSVLMLVGCTAKPDSVEPVENFELSPYLGKWYEIARLDHSFERGLSQVSAVYQPLPDGGIKVLNRGYSEEEQQWSQAEGKAHFVAGESTGHLKVSFFGPFYSSYVIFELGEEYDYAFVSGYNHDYLWLLSRTPQVAPALLERFKAVATEKGFDLTSLIMVEQAQP